MAGVGSMWSGTVKKRSSRVLKRRREEKENEREPGNIGK